MEIGAGVDTETVLLGRHARALSERFVESGNGIEAEHFGGFGKRNAFTNQFFGFVDF